MSDPYITWGEQSNYNSHSGQNTNTWNIPAPQNPKYTANPMKLQVIGVKNAYILHTEANYNGATSPLTVGTPFTITIFDTATRADAAEILLTNGSANTMVILGCGIYGQPVRRMSSPDGYVHDKYINYESIAIDGDKLFELGNNMICTLAQVNQLADWHWKRNKVKKHVYTITQVGMNTYFEPGEWYTLQVGSAGHPEYINSTVECYSIKAQLDAGHIAGTQIQFREIMQNWVFDSNETARTMASGGFIRKAQGRIVTIGSSTFIGNADYYCDGTSDEVEINQALTNLSMLGGGTVHLTAGTFNTGAAINIAASNMQLEGEGWGTIIKKNCNDYGVKAVGSSGTHLANLVIQNLQITRNSSDTNANYLLDLEYVDNSEFDNLYVYNGYSGGVQMKNCTNDKIQAGTIDTCSGIGLLVAGGIFVVAIGLSILSCTVGAQYTSDTSTNKITDSACETTTGPLLAGEASSYQISSTWARSSAQHYLGSYSFLFTLTGPSCYSYLHATNTYIMHGLTAGKSYTFQSEVYVPTAGGVNPGNVFMIIYYSTDGASWVPTYSQPMRNIKDAWQRMSVQVNLPSSTVGVAIFFQALGVNTNYFYVDEVYLYESSPVTTGLAFSNGYIKNCTNEGIMLICSGAVVSTSRIENNTNYGIDIVTGQLNTINGNWTANNGSDVGTDNSHNNNFYDGGIQTQWQS